MERIGRLYRTVRDLPQQPNGRLSSACSDFAAALLVPLSNDFSDSIVALQLLGLFASFHHRLAGRDNREDTRMHRTTGTRMLVVAGIVLGISVTPRFEPLNAAQAGRS